jgi:beta-N-acetylhexosaminidase
MSVGPLLFVGIPAPALDAETRRRLEQLQPGGIVLFRRNVGTLQAVARLTAELHALPSQPLVAIDHEGGRVMRLGEPFTQFPPAASIGRTRDAHRAFQVGHAMGEELASVGIDLSFAPVLDVHSNPSNPVIGDRAFGSDPELVADMGVALMRGLLTAGVIPCGKHFPGHGDTTEDSHLALPVVRRSRDELERRELAPFRRAIAAGVPMLMTAHVVYPGLDADHPATLSRKILTGVLREEMGFQGVVASDDLHMRAITDRHDIGSAAVAALAAGADVLLVCQELSQAMHARAAIEDALAGGGVRAETIAAAAARVQRLAAARGGAQAPTCVLPNAAHRDLAHELRNV